jgi:hypothetical protein
MKNYTKVNLTSSDLSLEKQEELRKILPEAFSEEKIDWEKIHLQVGRGIHLNILHQENTDTKEVGLTCPG